MNNAQTETIAEIPSRAIFGPLCILFSVALLYLRESPFFASLAAAALLGILLCWKWEKNGLMVSLAALFGVLCYEWQWSDDSLTLWELGLASSLGLAFFTTFLAKQEISELIEEHAIEKTELLQSDYESIQEVLRKYERVLKEKNQKIESLEKDLQTAPASFPGDQDLLREKEEAIKEKDVLIASLQSKEASIDEIERLQSCLNETQENKKQLQNVIEQQQTFIAELQLRIQNMNDGASNSSTDDLIQRYEAAIHERNLIIDELNERLDKMDVIQHQGIYELGNEMTEELRKQLLISDQKLAHLEMTLQEKSLKIAELQEKAQVAERVEHLQSELLQVQAQLDSYETVLQEKNIAIEQLQEKAKTAERVEHLQSELLQVQAQLDSYETVLQEKNIAIEQLREKAKTAERVEHLQSELLQVQAQLDSYETVLQEKNIAIEQLREKAKTAERVEHLQSELLQVQAQLDSYETVLQEKNIAIEQLQEKAKTAERVEHLQSELLQVQAQLDTYAKVIEDKNVQIAQLAETAEKIDLLEKELSEALQEANTYRQLATTREQELIKLNEDVLELAQIKEEHAFALDSLKNYEEVIQEKNKAIEELEQKAMAGEKLEALQLELTEAQESLRLANESYRDLQGQLDSLQGKYVEALKLEELTLTKDRQIQQLEENYRILREQVKEHEGFNHAKLLEKDRLIEKHAERARSLEEQVTQYQQKFEHFEANYVARELIEQYESKIKGLASQLEELIEKLKKVESEKDKIEKDLANTPSHAKELSRVQGMYKQLRTQFEEKSRVLNETRRELFLALEDKNKLELEFLELKKFDRAEEEAALEQYLLELSGLIEEQEREIEALHNIIAMSG